MTMPPPQSNPMLMLQQLMQQSGPGGRGVVAPQADPRAGAIEQYMAQQGQQSAMPVISPQQHMNVQAHMNPNAQMDDQGQYPGDGDEAQYLDGGEPEEVSDEEMLDQVHRHMMPGEQEGQMRRRGLDDREGQRQSDTKAMSHDSDSDSPSYRAWVEEHGREPETDAELEEAYGPDED